MEEFDFIDFGRMRLLQANSTTSSSSCLSVTNDTTTTVASDVQVIRNTLRIYGSLYLVLIILFCLFRTRFPKTYNVRNWVPELRIDLAKRHYSSIDWFWKLWWIPDDEFREQCGMDALCFIRMLRFGLQISLVGMCNSIWLLPTYGNARFSKETENVVDHLQMVTVAHLPPGSTRFFATVISAYITFGSVMYFLLKEFEWFTENRHKFLSAKKPYNYTVYVSHIPLEYRSSHKLLAYFRGCYSHDAVLEAHCALDIPDLEDKVREREGLIGKLEHAINIEEVTGEKPTHRNLLQGGVKVDTIPFYSDELKELNDEIRERIIKIEEMHDPLSFKKDLELQGGSVKPVSSVAFKDEVNSELSVNDDPIAVPNGAADKAQEGEKAEESGHSGLFNTMKGSMFGAAGNLAEMIVGGEDGDPREAGFVTFSKLSTAQSALQMIHHPTPFVMSVADAPEPDDIYWGNVGKNHQALQLGSLASLALTALLCFFWTIPVTFVVSLTEVSALTDLLPFLDPIIRDYPWVADLLAVLAPVMLIVLNAMLPVILGEFCKLEGPVSSSVLGASLFVKLAAFMIIQTFFVSAIAGSITASLQCIINDPAKGIDFLASSLPSQATYYVQLLLVRTFLGQGLELLRVIPVIIATIRSKLGPNLTAKERNSVWMGLKPLAVPNAFQYPEVASNIILYFMVQFVYSSLAPTTNWFMGFCFMLLISGYRHQLVYIYPSTPDSGGRLWLGFVGISQSCMLVAEFTLLGVLSLKRATLAAPFMFPLIIVTILFNFYIRQQHFFVTGRLPSRNCLKQDIRNQSEEMNFDFVRGKYLQPALQSKEDAYPENMGIAREMANQNVKFMTPPSSEAEHVELVANGDGEAEIIT